MMFGNFFESKKLKKAVRNAVVNNSVTSMVAGLQELNVIENHNRYLPFNCGWMANFALSASDGLTHQDNYFLQDSLLSFINLGLSLSLTTFAANSSGDDEQACLAANFMLSQLFLLIYMLFPKTETPARYVEHGPNTSPRERFEILNKSINDLIKQEKEKNRSSITQALARKITDLKQLQKKIEGFGLEYQNSNLELINDPITLPETGATCDREDVLNNIANKIYTCPKTVRPLTMSNTVDFVNTIKTNFQEKDRISTTLKQFETQFQDIKNDIKRMNGVKVEVKKASNETPHHYRSSNRRHGP